MILKSNDSNYLTNNNVTENEIEYVVRAATCLEQRLELLSDRCLNFQLIICFRSRTLSEGFGLKNCEQKT